MVLPPDAVIDLIVEADQDAVVSVDGQVDRELATGDTVTVCLSPYITRMVRFSNPQDYYPMLAERLDWLRALRASEHPEFFDLGGIPSSRP
jgi:NAD kinase